MKRTSIVSMLLVVAMSSALCDDFVPVTHNPLLPGYFNSGSLRCPATFNMVVSRSEYADDPDFSTILTIPSRRSRKDLACVTLPPSALKKLAKALRRCQKLWKSRSSLSVGDIDLGEFYSVKGCEEYPYVKLVFRKSSSGYLFLIKGHSLSVADTDVYDDWVFTGTPEYGGLYANLIDDGLRMLGCK